MQKRNELRAIVTTLEGASTRSGKSLVALAGASPVLLVFLRHAGCPFCREALGDIARARAAIEATGTRIILVHMRDSKVIDALVEKHGLAGVERICDRERRLYAAFGLKRGRLRQLLGLGVILRGFRTAILARHGIGWPSADSFQMPGLFLLDRIGIIRRVRHRTAAERPDYAALCLAASRSGL